MSETSSAASELHQPFAESFSRPEEAEARRGERLLAIRAGGASLVLRVRELSAIFRAGKIVPLPGARREVAGITGVRGQVVPVFELAELLGARDGSEAKWLAVVGRENPVALGFDEFEGYLEAYARELHKPDAHGAGLRHVSAIYGTGSTARGLVDLEALVKQLKEGTKA